jgi:uncharacterized protein
MNREAALPEVSPEAVIDRREFLTGATATAAFAALGASTAVQAFSSDYGPLSPVNDLTTGLPLLRLPEGFSYRTYGWTGQVQSDGRPTPALHDGMAVVAARGNTVALVRNHEQGAIGFVPATPASGAGVYDPAGFGGTTSLLFDTLQGQFLASFNSLGGTVANCAGGPTPWGTWLSCEETFAPWNATPGAFNHGYVFEVPGFGISDGQPIRALGRFSHEAAAVDPATGFVYLTEDAGSSAFYKFVPNGQWGNLKGGGTLYAMVLDATPRLDTRGLDTGSWAVTWQEITDPNAITLSCFNQASDAAIIRRGEGCWFDGGRVYFISTSGGSAGKGQVFEYDPRTETCTLLFSSPNGGVVDGPDNLCVSPRGSILMCEDGSSNPKRLVALTHDGSTFTFAENNIQLTRAEAGQIMPPQFLGLLDAVIPGWGDFRSFEWAGACFYDRWLFVNVQVPGVTFAITGPWEKGAL